MPTDLDLAPHLDAAKAKERNPYGIAYRAHAA
jgi:hypothetical protein